MIITECCETPPQQFNRLLLARLVVHCCVVLSVFFVPIFVRPAVGQTALSALDVDEVSLVPLWQRVPSFDFDWRLKEREPNRFVDIPRLQSTLLDERVLEARQVLLHPDGASIQGSEEARTILLGYLSEPISDRLAKLAFLSSAIKLCDRTHAAQLWIASKDDPAASLEVQRALIDWQSDVAIEQWRSEVRQAQTQGEAFQLAIRGLGAVGTADDSGLLREVLLADWATIPTRLEAAKSLGQVQHRGLEPLATQLLNSGAPIKELLSAWLLAEHLDPSAVAIQKQIFDSNDHAAQAVAYEALCKSSREGALSLAKDLLNHPDSAIRLRAVSLLAESDELIHLRTQGFALRDANPTIRRLVRANMERRFASNTQSREFVFQATQFYLNGDFEYAAEQAIVMAVRLRMVDRCGQIGKLLAHPEERVNIRAAWALQELAESPEVLAEAMTHALDTTEALATGKRRVFSEEITKTAFLFCAFGKNRYEPAVDMLMKYVPKAGHKMSTATRAAAIWALGNIWKERSNPALAKQLAQRMLDNTPSDPEPEIVKYNSAIALGLIRDPSSPEELQRVTEDYPDPLGHASRWACEQFGITEF